MDGWMDKLVVVIWLNGLPAGCMDGLTYSKKIIGWLLFGCSGGWMDERMGE